MANGVSIRLERAYTPEELGALDYLWFHAEQVQDQPGRNDEGLIILDSKARRLKRAFVCPRGWSYNDAVVRAEVKAGLERAGLSGVEFRPVATPGGRRCDDWWELTSRIVMPPLAPGVELSEGPKGYWVVPREGLYTPPELRYRREDIESMPAPDLAITRERMYGSSEYDYPKIVSSRFYQVCHENGWETNWVPVRVE